MQLWEDLDHQKFFLLNTDSGSKSACDRFGKFPKTFTPYKSGFANLCTSRITSPDQTYRVQPKKFDGYFQCPRPLGLAPSTKRIRLADDVSTLPKPAKFLQFSNIYEKQVPSKSPTSRPSVQIRSGTVTLEALKHDSLPKTTAEVKTFRDLKDLMEKDKKFNLSFTEKPSKPSRRKLKGYFTKAIPSSTDLFRKEKKMLTVTNPAQFSKQVKFEQLDRKYLEKRRNQKILRDKLEIFTN
jgi:hypothetical protein